MRNAGLEETQAGIKIAGRNINNLRYADDTLMAESEELKIFRNKKYLTVGAGQRIQMVSGGSFTVGHCALLSLFEMLSTTGLSGFSVLSLSRISWPIPFVDFTISFSRGSS